MKKLLSVSLLMMLVLPFLAVPVAVSAAATCNVQCEEIYSGELENACKKGCTGQQTMGTEACLNSCDTTYPNSNSEASACKRGCTLQDAPVTDISEIEDFVIAVSRWVAIIVSTLAIIIIIWGGAQYMTSGGDPEKAGVARKTITYGLVGLAIAVLAWGAELFVRSILGFRG